MGEEKYWIGKFDSDIKNAKENKKDTLILNYCLHSILHFISIWFQQNFFDKKFNFFLNAKISSSWTRFSFIFWYWFWDQSKSSVLFWIIFLNTKKNKTKVLFCFDNIFWNFLSEKIENGNQKKRKKTNWKGIR